MNKKKSFFGFSVSLKTKIWITAAIGAAALIAFLAMDGPSMSEKLSLTYLDSLTANKIAYELQESYDQPVEVQDYTIYGQALNLYALPWTEDTLDPLYGKNVSLRSLETGEYVSTTFSGGADSGIDLSSLDAGVYEVFVYEGYEPRRVYMSEETHLDPFTTTRNNKSVNTINIDADADYLSRFGVESDRNYLYLTVTETLPKVRISDVVLDPSGMMILSDGTMDEGYESDILSEKQASWSLAMKIQAILEENGVRVTLSRQENESAGYLGSDSRVARGYDSQAKLFITLSMDASDWPRPYIVSSPYTSGFLGNQIAACMEEDGLELSNVSNLTRLESGNKFDDWLLTTDYQYSPWTTLPSLRETGGRVTRAGTLDLWQGNAQYADSNGMYGLVIYYASTENEDSQRYFVDHEQTMADAIAQGILKYLGTEIAEEQS